MLALILTFLAAARTVDRADLDVLPEGPAGSDPALHGGMAFRDFANAWTDGSLAGRYPDDVPKKRSSRSDRARLTKYILPVIGNRVLSEFEGVRGLELADAVRRRLPPELSRASRRHVAQIIHRLLVIAVYPSRLIAASPLPRGWLPRGSPSKAKSYLYPSEDRQLLARTAVPLLNRLFYGFLSREGLRVSEARSLRVKDIDFAHGVIHLDENKTDDPRSWALSPGVLVALRRYLERHRPDAGPEELLFVDPAGRRPPGDNLARAFRRDLGVAEVDRSQLFMETPERKRIRGHDLRATFVTVNLANGKTETWIADRTGHKSSQMIAKYRRMARTHAELNLGELAPLVDTIPELAGDRVGPRSKRRQGHLRLVEPVSGSNAGKGIDSSGGDGNSE